MKKLIMGIALSITMSSFVFANSDIKSEAVSKENKSEVVLRNNEILKVKKTLTKFDDVRWNCRIDVYHYTNGSLTHIDTYMIYNVDSCNEEFKKLGL